MSRMVRLPGHVPDDELRVWWDRTDGGNGLHVHGPGDLHRFALSILGSERLQVRGDATMATRLELERSHLEREASPLAQLEAAGYDPTTLVLSIRRKGVPQEPVEVADDIRAKLEELQAYLSDLTRAVGAIEEIKGLFVMTEEERDAIVDSAAVAEGAVEAALDKLSEAGTAQASSPAPDATGHWGNVARTGGVDFGKVVVLSWEDADGTDGDGTHWHLLDKGQRVGEVYATEEGRVRWRCTVTDWRSIEDSMQAARDALVVNYCQHYANEARELLRSAKLA